MDTKKYILITGASSGLGNALVHALAGAGYTVFAGVRSDSDKRTFNHRHIEPVICDVTSPEDIDHVFERVHDRTGGDGLFALINNAGINYISPFETADSLKERYLFDVNLFGPMMITRKLLPLMHQYAIVSGDRGKIINVGSIGSIFGLPWEAAYHASKFALLGWSQSLRFELEALRIDVSCFLPGGMKTRIFDKSSTEDTSSIPADHLHRAYYESNKKHMFTVMRQFEKGAASPNKAARLIVNVLNKKKPPLKVYFGRDAYFIRVLSKLGIIHLLRGQFVAKQSSKTPGKQAELFDLS